MKALEITANTSCVWLKSFNPHEWFINGMVHACWGTLLKIRVPKVFYPETFASEERILQGFFERLRVLLRTLFIQRTIFGRKDTSRVLCKTKDSIKTAPLFIRGITFGSKGTSRVPLRSQPFSSEVLFLEERVVEAWVLKDPEYSKVANCIFKGRWICNHWNCLF